MTSRPTALLGARRAQAGQRCDWSAQSERSSRNFDCAQNVNHWLGDHGREKPLRASSPATYVALYATLYGAFGAASPFIPRLFESRGLTNAEIGAVLAAGLVMRLAAGPVLGRAADRSGRLRIALGLCLTLAAATNAVLAGAEGFVFILVLTLVQAAALAPTTSIADALTVSTDPPTHRRGRFEYGWIRGGASLAFVLGTLLAGQLIRADDIAPAIWASAVLLLTAAVLTLAPTRRPAAVPVAAGGSQSSLAAIRTLIGLKGFRSVIAVPALIYGSHAMYDSFAVIRWTAAGLEPTTVSLLWSEAVAAEVVFFTLVGPPLIRWLGSRGAAVLAAVAGIIRWSAMAYTSSLPILLVVQPLHGLTFALLHLACMRLMADTVPPALAATAQALYAFGPVLLTAVLMWASGLIYGTGPAPFLSMAMLCVFAIPVALKGLPVGPGQSDRKV